MNYCQDKIREKVSIFVSINRFMENEMFAKIGNELPIFRKNGQIGNELPIFRKNGQIGNELPICRKQWIKDEIPLFRKVIYLTDHGISNLYELNKK